MADLSHKGRRFISTLEQEKDKIFAKRTIDPITMIASERASR